MMNKSCPRVSFDFSGRFLPPVYILVFIVGLVANGWGLKSLLHNWKKLGNINVFVLNLGLADVLYLLTVPFLVVYYLMGSKWIFGDNLNLWSRVLLNQKLCPEWSNGVYIAHQISRGLVCQNSALNPLVYLHGDENIPAQLRQPILRAREIFRRFSNSSSVRVAQTTVEV
ncbi:hypothetical protein NQZ68_023256 [Dissostichus eleginoides]|nr:hypothetical protein NQZ68_023256 [Dissostichus eleginoides]